MAVTRENHFLREPSSNCLSFVFVLATTLRSRTYYLCLFVHLLSLFVVLFAIHHHFGTCYSYLNWCLQPLRKVYATHVGISMCYPSSFLHLLPIFVIATRIKALTPCLMKLHLNQCVLPYCTALTACIWITLLCTQALCESTRLHEAKNLRIMHDGVMLVHADSF